eukprot:Skav228208  [mRNA]  locus=scaffold3219:11371:15125:+ [translate_table: standard]
MCWQPVAVWSQKLFHWNLWKLRHMTTLEDPGACAADLQRALEADNFEVSHITDSATHFSTRSPGRLGVALSEVGPQPKLPVVSMKPHCSPD